MKMIKGKWLAGVFALVMGLAAGAATVVDNGYVNEALTAIAKTDGAVLLGMSVTGILLNSAFFCWSSVAKGNMGIIMSVIAIWIKAVLIGLLFRELISDISAVKVMIGLLTLFGGGCICASFIMDREQNNDKAKRLAVWLSGVTVEGIMIPSVVRTWMLLFN